MKHFDLQEYLKNPDRKLVTRDGRSARIICTDRKGVGVDSPYPIVALIECHDEIGKTENVMTFTPEGRQRSKSDSDVDLFFDPEKKEGWVNIYKYASGHTHLGKIYNSKEEAETNHVNDYVTTIKIEWEE